MKKVVDFNTTNLTEKENPCDLFSQSGELGSLLSNLLLFSPFFLIYLIVG